MNINQLEYFASIVNEGSMQKAAAKLYITQPALSSAIAGLEKELGHSLFRRSSTGMELTPYGERVYSEVTVALERLDTIGEITREEDENVEINISYPPALSGRVIPRTVRRFRECYPNAQLKLNEWVSEGPSVDGKLSVKDFTFIVAFDWMLVDAVSKKNKVVAMQLTKMRQVAWLNKNSSLAEKDVVSIEDCKDGLLLVQRRNCARFERILPDVAVNTLSTGGMRDFLRENKDAIGIMADLFGGDALMESGEDLLVMRPVDFIDEEFSVMALYDGTRPLSAPEQTFLSYLQEEAHEARLAVDRIMARREL